MTEIFFYHLTRSRLENALPSLLETCLTRGWKAVVQAGSSERVDALDALLWTYRDDSFLPHGTASGKFAAEQPIVLTQNEDVPNGAQVKFFIDGVQIETDKLSGLNRAVLLFDGEDEQSLNDARAQWAALKKSGATLTYWQQNEKGGWEKQAA